MVCFGAAARVTGRPQLLHDIPFALAFGLPHPIPLMMNSKAIIGVNMLRVADQRPLALKRCLDAVVRLALNGEIQPTVGGRFTVETIAAAHAFLEGRASTGKVVVTWNR